MERSPFSEDARPDERPLDFATSLKRLDGPVREEQIGQFVEDLRKAAGYVKKN